MSAAVPVAAAPSIDLRFAQLIQQFGLTKNSFAISLGKTASVVQHLIDGRNKPGFDLLCRVFDVYPNVSRDWLLLGRGPMLVSSGASARPAPAAENLPPEPPLDPIDLSDVEPRVPRRASVSLAGGRLNPADIAATLVLAAAAAEPDAFTSAGTSAAESGSGDAPNEPVELERAAVMPTIPAVAAVAAQSPAPASSAAVETAATSLPSQPAAFVASAPVFAPPLALPAAPVQVPPHLEAPVSLPASPQPSPEVYLTAALHAQQLQHQLAMAELRNQHLLEQQQMLREMLAMARQAMV